MSDSSPPTSNNINHIKANKPFRNITLPEMIMNSNSKDKEKEQEDDDVVAMKKSVKDINFGTWEEKAAAAAEIKRLAAMSDGRTRRRLAELGVVPPLVAMLFETEEATSWRLAVEALVELAKGTFRNKKLMVEAGLLSKLPQLMRNSEFLKDQQFALLLLSISSLAKTEFPIKAHHLLPFIIENLDSEDTNDEAKLTSIATLHNLSTKLDNTRPIVASGAVHPLLILSMNKKTSEGALATLGNLMMIAIGKKAIEDDPLVLEVFLEILAWDDKPKCQEIATYLLMVIAHKSATKRLKMLRMGIVAVLIKVALLGSALARKRAFKLLEWFKDEKQSNMRMHSGPIPGGVPLSSNCIEEEMEEGQKAIKIMVKQSLNRNMELLMKRANGLEGSSGLKSLVATSSSKSLPY